MHNALDGANCLRMKNPTDDPNDAMAREMAELFRAVSSLAEKIGAGPLREALAESIILTADASVRAQHDNARKELDAFLRSKSEGTSAVGEPDGFVASPEVTPEAVDDIAKQVADASDKPRH